MDGDLERPKRGLGGTAKVELDGDPMALYSCLTRGRLMLLGRRVSCKSTDPK